MSLKYKAARLALFASVICALTGCQLAREDAEGGDRLIGVFITREPLNLFDFERYFADNAWHLNFSGGEIIMDEPARAYEGRMYATLTTTTLTAETGEAYEHDEYVFEGLAGIPFYAATMPLKGSEDSYIGLFGGDEISGPMSINAGDNEDSIKLEGTILVSSKADSHVFFSNPVYQSGDGRVYLTAGTGISGNLTGGSSLSQTLDAAETITANGVTKKRSISVRLEIRGMAPPERIVLLQMDEGGSLLSRREYAPGTLPQALRPHKDAAYLIAETYSGETVTREVHDSGSEGFDTFYVREDGICIKSHTRLDADRTTMDCTMEQMRAFFPKL